MTYDEVSPTRQWPGALDELWPELRTRAYKRALDAESEQEAWWWVMRPDGLVIACMVRDDFRKVVRLSRREPVAPDAWTAEVQAVLEHFTVPGQWYEIQPEGESDAAHVATFVELRSNEHAPGLTRCADCEGETPSTPITVPMRCEDCRRLHRLRALPDVPDWHPAIIGERD